MEHIPHHHTLKPQYFVFPPAVVLQGCFITSSIKIIIQYIFILYILILHGKKKEESMDNTYIINRLYIYTYNT